MNAARARPFALACLGLLLFVAPLKFSAPVVVQSVIPPPQTTIEWLFFSWPNQLAVMFAVATLAWWLAAPAGWLGWLVLAWLGTQCAATLGSVCPQVSSDVIVYFVACAIVFFAAAHVGSDDKARLRLFSALGLATLFVSGVALQQHFGGLENTRQFAAEQFNLATVPRDLVGKLTSNRVFGTLTYPNSLAGYLVVAGGPTLAWLWERGRVWRRSSRWLVVGAMAALLVFCLLLTGSRGGLVAFGAAAATALAVRRKRAAIWLATGVVLAAVVLVALQAGWMHLGRSSVAARGDYWKGAAAIARQNFWLGSGPGTFGSVFLQYKNASSDEAQLVHNNFLEMWSDSGVAAFVVFAGLWIIGVAQAFRLARREPTAMNMALAASLAGWVVHGLVDFDLYVPGIALPAFALLGLAGAAGTSPASGPIRFVTPAVIVAVVLWISGVELAAVAAFGQYANHGSEAGLRRARELAPANSRFAEAAGDLAFRRRQLDEAVACYQAAVANDPRRPSYHWRLGRAWAREGRVDRALEELRTAARLYPANAVYQRELAAAEAAAGKR